MRSRAKYSLVWLAIVVGACGGSEDVLPRVDSGRIVVDQYDYVNELPDDVRLNPDAGFDTLTPDVGAPGTDTVPPPPPPPPPPGTCEPLPPQACYQAVGQTQGVGRCRTGSRIVYNIGDEPPLDGPCQGQVTPIGELCNGLDDDCDGVVDNAVDCTEPLEPECGPTRPCATGQCAEVGVVDAACIPPQACDPVTDNGCSGNQQCETFGSVTGCWEPPQTTCLGHYWYMSVNDATNQAGHLDTAMNCVPEWNFQDGSDCVVVPSGDDVELACDHAVRVGARRSAGYSHDFIALDFPIHAPAGISKCLIGWGVHPMVESAQALTPGGSVINRVTARIGGGAQAMQPVTAGGLTTELPSAAFQQVVVVRPAATAVPVPTNKAQRSAKFLWAEPSAAFIRAQPLHAGYAGCPGCTTYEQLVEHVYPGPEIALQGLPRDPADSQFVIPFWLPYYDALLQTQQLAIVAEMLCVAKNGALHRTVSVLGMPWDNAALPSLNQPVAYPSAQDQCGVQ